MFNRFYVPRAHRLFCSDEVNLTGPRKAIMTLSGSLVGCLSDLYLDCSSGRNLSESVSLIESRGSVAAARIGGETISEAR